MKDKLFGLLVVCLLCGCDAPLHLAPDATLPDGSTYVGDVVDGRFHGQGSWKLKEGGFYQGQFANGLMHGQGKFEDKWGDVFTGEFDNGNATGRFTVTNKDKSFVYKGELVDWRFSGHGEYQNEFERYTGQFLDGKYHGYGELEYLDSEDTHYAGEFENGVFHGQGEYTAGTRLWVGQFENGDFTGEGSHTDEQNNLYQGQFENWLLHGRGTVTSKQGEVQSGNFDRGYLSGTGKIEKANGEIFTGEFSFGSLDGVGEHIVPNVSQYQGEFSYSEYSGQGKLTRFNDGEVIETLKGRWRRGHFVGAGENPPSQGEIALSNHNSLLKQAIDNLQPSEIDTPNVYFLGIAGDGTQSVFKREIKFVQQALRQRFATNGRELLLINHHTSAAEFPMATRAAIKSAIKGIADRMDISNDVLVAYFTSHGSHDHKLTLKHGDINLSSIAAEELGAALRASNIKWKLLFVSACFSGGFIPHLQDDTTMIVTAADADSQSFGCSEKSDGTYFGKALFIENPIYDSSLSVPDVFVRAQETIQAWENEQEYQPSNPQIFSTQLIEQKLASLTP